jgi:hypothetical protein
MDKRAQSWRAFARASLCLRAIGHDLILRRIDFGGIFIGVTGLLDWGLFLLGFPPGLVADDVVQLFILEVVPAHLSWRVLMPALDILFEPIENLVDIVLHTYVLAHGHLLIEEQ